MNKEIKGIITKRRKLSFLGFSNIIVMGTMAIISIYLLHSSNWTIFFILLMVIPSVLITLFIRVFSETVIIKILPDAFLIEPLTRSHSSIEIKLVDLKYYVIRFPTEKFISIIFKSEFYRKEFSFYEINSKNSEMSGEEIIAVFKNAIREYNDNSGSSEKILFKPSFLASKEGLRFIWIVSLLTLVLVIAGISIKGKSVPFTTIFSLVLLSSLFLRRGKELRTYEDMK